MIEVCCFSAKSYIMSYFHFSGGFLSFHMLLHFFRIVRLIFGLDPKCNLLAFKPCISAILFGRSSYERLIFGKSPFAWHQLLTAANEIGHSPKAKQNTTAFHNLKSKWKMPELSAGQSASFDKEQCFLINNALMGVKSPAFIVQ